MIGVNGEGSRVLELSRLREEGDEDVKVVARDYQEDVGTVNKEVELSSKQTSAMQDMGGTP